MNRKSSTHNNGRRATIRPDSRRFKMKRITNIIVFAAAILAALIAAKAISQDELGLGGPTLMPRAVLFRSVDWIKNQALPTVVWAKIIPGSQRLLDSGITSRMINGKTTVTKEVKTYLSANGGKSWKTYDLAQVEQDHWAAKMTANSGVGTLASFYARNVLGGSMVDLACMMSSTPAPTSGFFDMKDRQPKGCFFASGSEEPPIDDSSSRIGEDLDIFDFRIGYDSKYIYFGMMIDGEYSKGSLTPTVLNQYSVMMFNPEAAGPVPDGVLPLSGVMVRYIPMGKEAPSMAQSCGAVIYRNKTTVLDTTPVTCKVNGQYLMFKVRRDLWGTKPPRELFVFAYTGTLRERNLSELSFVDSTSFTRVRFAGSVLKLSASVEVLPRNNDKSDNKPGVNYYH